MRIEIDKKTPFEVIKENMLKIIEEIVNDAHDALDFNKAWEDFDPEEDEPPQCVSDINCGKNVSCLLCPEKLFGVCYFVIMSHIQELTAPQAEDPDDDQKMMNKQYGDYLSEQVESIQIDRLFIYDYISSESAFVEKKSEIRKTKDIQEDNLNILALFNLFVLKRLSTNGNE